MKVLVHIPARGGSRGLPGKNLLPVGGRSLVARAIDAGRAFLTRSGETGRVLVDTDSEAIAAAARAEGVEVPFLRPAELARDTTPTLETVLHAVDRLAEGGETAEVVVLLQPTSPLRSADDVLACWQAFDADAVPSVVSVVACSHPPELTLRLDDRGRVGWAFGAPPSGVRRQDLAPAYRPNGAVYVDTVAFLREERNFIVPGRTVGVEMPVDRSVDIDDAFDLALANALIGPVQKRTP